MVRHAILATCLVLTLAHPAGAQSIDWTSAGGGLFGPVPEERLEPDAAVPRLPPLTQPFQDAVEAAAAAHGLDSKLLHALVITESGYRPDARSHAGAAGLTQLMPGTAEELGVRDRFDPVENLNGGADYLARQILRFGDLRLALAAYNAGPARVARLGRIPDIAETRNYVDAVIECFLALSAARAAKSSRQCETRSSP